MAKIVLWLRYDLVGAFARRRNPARRLRRLSLGCASFAQRGEAEQAPSGGRTAAAAPVRARAPPRRLAGRTRVIRSRTRSCASTSIAACVYLPDERKYVVTLRHFRGEITVEEAAFFVRAFEPGTARIALSDRSEETLDPATLAPSPIDGALLCRVKRALAPRAVCSRASRHAAQAESPARGRRARRLACACASAASGARPRALIVQTSWRVSATLERRPQRAPSRTLARRVREREQRAAVLHELPGLEPERGERGEAAEHAGDEREPRGGRDPACSSASVASTPIAKQPVTFTANVPHGNPGPVRASTQRPSA